jgi:hypothetical protein
VVCISLCSSFARTDKSVDPLRKRPSTFNRSSKEVVVDNTMWTETPAQKYQRMADEAAGIKRHKDPVKGEKDQSFETKGKRQRDEELKAQVERHSVGLGLANNRLQIR